jgi:hypothetical protein
MQQQKRSTWFQGLKLFNESANVNPDTWTVPKKGSPAYGFINNSLRIPSRAKFVSESKTFNESIDSAKANTAKRYEVFKKFHTPMDYSVKIAKRKKLKKQLDDILSTERKSERIKKGVNKPARFRE